MQIYLIIGILPNTRTSKEDKVSTSKEQYTFIIQLCHGIQQPDISKIIIYSQGTPLHFLVSNRLQQENYTLAIPIPEKHKEISYVILECKNNVKLVYISMAGINRIASLTREDKEWIIDVFGTEFELTKHRNVDIWLMNLGAKSHAFDIRMGEENYLWKVLKLVGSN